MRFLLVEDDEFFAQTLSTALTEQHYVVDIATNGEEGWDYSQSSNYDLILLDISLPKLNGISLCRRLREVRYEGPILLLTAKADSQDKVTGLDAGADDYVVKPCTIQELFARIRALLRRRKTSSAPVLEWGDLRLDPNPCEVTYNGKPLSLSPKEYSLLELFLRSPGRILSRGAILENLWSFEDCPGEETVRAHIKRLRRQLKNAGADDMIETIYGMGYRLKPPPDNKAAKEREIKASVHKAWERLRVPIMGRLTSIEGVITALETDTLTEELRRLACCDAHKLAGSLGMFGLEKGSRVAREIEHVLEELVDLDRTGDSRESSSSTPSQLLLTTKQRSLQRLQSMLLLLRRELLEPLQSETTSSEDINPTPVAPLEQVSTLPFSHRSDSPEGTIPWSTANEHLKHPLLLVVDSDIQLTGQLMRRGASWNIRVNEASTLSQARAAMAREIPDIVLLDLAFSEASLDGLVLLEELTSQFPHLPVLVYTIRDGFNDRVTVARLGGRAFLPKPVTAVQVLEAVRDILKQTRRSQAKILAVDDDSVMLERLQCFLQPWSVELHTLDDPRQFWDVLEATVPDLLILDTKMPHINGIELCQVVRNDRTWNEVPIIFLSAHKDPETIHRIYQAGADDYISKPVTEPELITRIFNRLERTRLLRNLAETDALTGLANRRQSTLVLKRYIRLAKRYQMPLSFAVINLDGFKQVNNQYGHAMADKVLARLAQLLRQEFRGEDIVARWYGAEFVVGMYGMSKHDGVRRLNEFLQLIRQESFDIPGGSSLRVTFSAGVVEYPEDGSDLQSLYRAADTAVAQVKAAGGEYVLGLRTQ